VRSPDGYVVATGPDGTREADSVMCAHCGKHTLVGTGSDPAEFGGWCHPCGAYVCGPCNSTGVCDPLEKKLDRSEKRDRMLRTILRGSG